MVNVGASEKNIYSTSKVPLTLIESNDQEKSFFRSVVSFANPTKNSEFNIDLEVPEGVNCKIFGCSVELHGGMENFNPS